MMRNGCYEDQLPWPDHFGDLHRQHTTKRQTDQYEGLIFSDLFCHTARIITKALPCFRFQPFQVMRFITVRQPDMPENSFVGSEPGNEVSFHFMQS